MHRRQGFPVFFVWVGVVSLGLGLAACSPAPTPTPTPTPPPPTVTPTPTPLPILPLDQTSVKDFVISDFDAVHAPVNGDANEHLIYGNLPVSKPAADLPPEQGAFLGRWEGYSYAPPVKKDTKVVVVIQSIAPQGGTLYVWAGTNLQYPDMVSEVHFRVLPGPAPAIEFQALMSGGAQGVFHITYNHDKDQLEGWLKFPGDGTSTGPFELTRAQSFYVYKDYAQYLAGKRIYPKAYQSVDMQRYGKGYLLYLPTGYEDNPAKTWPLIFFLHGSGDRGDNLFLLAKASPFMFIREKGPLPCIIAAPLLAASRPEFPSLYLEGALAEIQANYRVDPQRIYLTGLSLGGEATYRLAVDQPDTFAALAPLSAFANADTLAKIDRIKALPVWAIHGADDTVVPLGRGQVPVDALKAAGGNVKFTILPDHDHDTWTDTYSDPAFYDWLWQHTRP